MKRKPDDFKTKLGGRTWTIRFVRRGHPKIGKCLGICDRFDRIIYVRYDVCERTFVDTLVHEMEHALTDLHFFSEEWVTQTGTEISTALIAAGVRSQWHDKQP